MPRYRRHFTEGQTVFLTLATYGRRPWLAIRNTRDIVLDALRQTRAHHPFIHKGHVLLDDHLHLLLAPHASVAIPGLVGSFKRAAMTRLPIEAGRRLWQPRYYDHIIRDDDDFARHLDYLHFNPVKHGLVADAMAWQWSSVYAWKARGVYPEDWGKCEPERIRCMTE